MKSQTIGVEQSAGKFHTCIVFSQPCLLQLFIRNQ